MSSFACTVPSVNLFIRVSIHQENSPTTIAPAIRPLPFRVCKLLRMVVSASSLPDWPIHAGTAAARLAISSAASSRNISTISASASGESTGRSTNNCCSGTVASLVVFPESRICSCASSPAGNSSLCSKPSSARSSLMTELGSLNINACLATSLTSISELTGLPLTCSSSCASALTELDNIDLMASCGVTVPSMILFTRFSSVHANSPTASAPTMRPLPFSV